MTDETEHLLSSPANAQRLLRSVAQAHRDRDFDANPYSPDEARVARWIAEKTGIGGGDDPIGFLIASHEMMAIDRERWRKAYEFVRKRAKLEPNEVTKAAMQETLP